MNHTQYIDKKSNQKAQPSTFTTRTCTRCPKTLILDYRAASISFESYTLERIPQIEEGFIDTTSTVIIATRTLPFCSPETLKEKCEWNTH